MVCSRRDQAEGVAFPDLGNTEGRAALIQRVKHFRPSLVIIDNVSTLVTVADENAADSWNDFLETLQALQTSGAAVLVIHHARKNNGGKGGYRGSQKLSVLFDAIIALDEADSSLGGAAFSMVFEKNRRLSTSARCGLKIELQTDDEGSRWKFEESADARLLTIVKAVKSLEFATQKDLAEYLDESEGNLSKLKKNAIAAGLIRVDEWADCLAAARQLQDEEKGIVDCPAF